MDAYIVTSVDIQAFAYREAQVDVPGEPPALGSGRSTSYHALKVREAEGL